MYTSIEEKTQSCRCPASFLPFCFYGVTTGFQSLLMRMSLKHLVVEDITSMQGYKPIAVGNNTHFTEQWIKQIYWASLHIFLHS